MIICSPKTHWSEREISPQISEKSHVFKTAAVVGAVCIDEGVLVSPGASIRGDEGMPIYIGRDSNVQDLVVLHGLMGKRMKVHGTEYAIYVGERVSCGHSCVIHGPCCIESDTFVGFNAVVHGSVVGSNVYIGYGAQVVDVHIPAGRFVNHGITVCTQEQADVLPPVPDQLKGFNALVVAKNTELAQKYLQMKEINSI